MEILVQIPDHLWLTLLEFALSEHILFNIVAPCILPDLHVKL